MKEIIQYLKINASVKFFLLKDKTYVVKLGNAYKYKRKEKYGHSLSDYGLWKSGFTDSFIMQYGKNYQNFGRCFYGNLSMIKKEYLNNTENESGKSTVIFRKKR